MYRLQILKPSDQHMSAEHCLDASPRPADAADIVVIDGDVIRISDGCADAVNRSDTILIKGTCRPERCLVLEQIILIVPPTLKGLRNERHKIPASSRLPLNHVSRNSGLVNTGPSQHHAIAVILGPKAVGLDDFAKGYR